MELLIAALAELAVAALVAMVLLFVNAFLALLEAMVLLVQLAGGLLSFLFSGRSGDGDSSHASPVRAGRGKLRRVLLWTLGICLSLGIFSAAFLAAVNAWYFDSGVRFVANRIGGRATTALTFDRAEGNLWEGRIRLLGVAAVRGDHPRDRFDLRCREVALDISLPALLRWSVVFEHVDIVGVTGAWDRLAKTEGMKPRRDFTIDRLELRDFDVSLTDASRPTPVAARLRIDSLAVSPLRGSLAMFDLLFHSSGAGSLNDSPFRSESGDGRQSFRLDGAPVNLAAAFLGYPLTWFDKGVVDIAIANTFKDSANVEMQWSVVFRDFHMSAPKGTSLKSRVAAMPLVAWFNRKSARLPLEFELEVKEGQFRYKASSQLDFLATMAAKAIQATTARLWKTMQN